MLGVISVLAVAAATFQVDVPAVVGDKLDPVPFDVYYPDTIPSPQKRVFVDVGATDTSYTLDIGLARNCRGGGACYLAYVTAEQGATFLAPKRIRLRGGVKGRYAPSRCGANCSAPLIEFKRGGFKYTVAVKSVATRKQIKRIANSALRAGPR